MQPTDIAAIRIPSDPRLSPDGHQVAFVVSRPSVDEDAYRRSLWLHDGTSALELTSGYEDTRPRWSPDGSRLLFLRAPLGRPSEATVVVMDLSSGDIEEIAAFSVGASEAEWSPDGKAIAVAATEWIAPYVGLSSDERDRLPARLRRAHFQVDNKLPAHDRRKHIWIIEDGEKRQLTDGDFDEHDLCWHPGGQRLAFLSSRGAGTEPGNQVFEIGVDDGAEEVRTGPGFFDCVAYDPAGRLHAVGLLDPWEHPGVASVFRFGSEGPIDLTGDLDRNPLPFSPTIAPKGPRFLGDGFVTTLEDDGRIHVVHRMGESTEMLIGGDVVVYGVDAAASAMAYVATTPTSPGELYALSGGETTRLTQLNDDLDVVAPQQFIVESDGVDVTAWVYLPPGDAEVPVLFNIHGGPASQYGVGFFDEFQVYVGSGYGVVACNPRGSSGRGEEFVRAVVGTWGAEETPPDIRDLEAVITTALERFPRLDASRVGVMGGSYGGWAAAQLISRSDRFRSAVVERAVTAWQSFWGTSDIGPWFSKMYLGTDLADDWEGYRRASPMARAHEITTPTLVVHSVSDWRTPLEQGLQLFTMLQHRGVPSELIRFPEEGHELSRSGKPRHRVERFEAILDWHGRYL